MTFYVTMSYGEPFGDPQPTQAAAFALCEADESRRIKEDPDVPDDADVSFTWYTVDEADDTSWEMYVTVDDNEHATGVAVEEFPGEMPDVPVS